VIVHGDLPVNAGCASSSALMSLPARAARVPGPGAAALAEPRRPPTRVARRGGPAGGPGGRWIPHERAWGSVHLSFGPTPFVQKALRVSTASS
jgi:hypothetical protein